MLLLATGSSPADLENSGMGGVAISGIGTVLGEATVAWLAGPRRPGEDSIADRVELEVGRERSETGYATIQADLRIVPRWYLRFERDRWDNYDAGVLWRLRFR